MGLSQESVVALIALIISLVALSVTGCQLIAQVFSTADGLRRCQESVIGPWAQETKLRWHWRQFRFETHFSSPDIALEYVYSCPSEENLPRGQHGLLPLCKAVTTSQQDYDHTPIAMTGTTASRKETHIIDRNRLGRSTSLASWTSFLSAVQDHVEKYATPQSSPRLYPVIRKIRRSWDFMPAEVIRPLATTNVGDIAVLACRMGMRWIVFKPYEDIMRAEGGPHIFNSVSIRGLGLVLEYKRSSTSWRKPYHREKANGFRDGRLRDSVGRTPEMNVWNSRADRLLFGIITETPSLGIPRLAFGNTELLIQTFGLLHGSEDRARHFSNGSRSMQFALAHAGSDVLSMACPMIREKGSPFNQLFIPGYSTGMTFFRAGYLVWFEQVEKEFDTRNRESAQLEWLLQSFLSLSQRWPALWPGPASREDTSDILPFLDAVFDLYEETERYFQKIVALLPVDTADSSKSPDTGIEYIDLLSTHLYHAPQAELDAQKNVREGHRRKKDNTGDYDWRDETMYCYFDNISKHVEFLSTRGCKDPNIIFNAWATMIFRGFLWQRSHANSVFQGIEPPLDAKYYRSKMPVYIG